MWIMVTVVIVNIGHVSVVCVCAYIVLLLHAPNTTIHMILHEIWTVQEPQFAFDCHTKLKY